MVSYGDLREWDPGALTSTSTELRANLRTLERARDELQSKGVPETWRGISALWAQVRLSAMIGQMDHHLQGVSDFERVIYEAQGRVAAIETLVTDLESDARSQEFEIGADGSVTDVSEPERFDSVRAAEARTAQRIELRDALARRVRSVLDDAVEVDSLLVHARPEDSFSSDGPQGVVDPGVERQWAKMSDAQRRAVLEEMAGDLAGDYDLGEFEIRFEDLEDQDGDGVDDDPGTDSHGSWSEDDRVLRIDVNDLDDPETIDTIAHEVRHAAQHENVRDAFPDLLGRWAIEEGIVEDPFNPPPGVTREEVEDWRDNFEDYQTPDDDGFDAYYDQPVERDAREAGEDYLDDLTGEDLERIREEAG